MYTPLPDSSTPLAQEAADLIKACVHCGFCLPACPTYSLLGDERDSPRGRIYLIKSVAEGMAPSEITRTHLDRCLTCRACETACPSGVRYGQLVDVGRAMVDAVSPRPIASRMQRAVLGAVLSHRRVFALLVTLGRVLRPVLPRKLAQAIPPAQSADAPLAAATTSSTIVLHRGCVQPALAPQIDASACRVLERAGTRCERAQDVCCGALNHHLGRHEVALAQMRRNVDVWTQHLDAGAKAIVSSASGCAVMIKDYGHVLRDDARYAQAAARVSACARDLSEVIEPGGAAQSKGTFTARVAWHAPCTLQHGQKIRGRVEQLLSAAGYDVRAPADASRCCGSAGTYSILEPRLSSELRELKVRSLEDEQPDIIATANIGCLEQLRRGTQVPVRHWVELVDAAQAARISA